MPAEATWIAYTRYIHSWTTSEATMIDRNMITIIAMLFALLSLSTSVSFGKDLGGAEEKAVSSFIAREAERLGGEENSDARSWLHESAFADGQHIAVLYTLEGIRGGTDWLQYLTIFTMSDKGALPDGTIRIGGKGIRAIEKVDGFVGGVVTLSVRYYSKSDALCCPSIPGTLRVVGSSGEWQEFDVIVNCP